MKTLFSLMVPLMTLPAQSMTWVLAHPAQSPAPREAHAMATDTLRGRVVLFGGNANSIALSDLWEWSNDTWTRLPAPPVPGRWNHALVYDRVRDRLVVFGGDNGSSLLADTWEYDGSNWILATPPSVPLPRSGMGSTFASHTARTFIFGGITVQAGTISYLADTWTWDGTTWSSVPSAPGPRGRTECSLAYDETRQRVVLHGGAYADQSNSYYLADTWELVGTNWQPRVSVQFPSSWASHAMAYDTNQRSAVLFSGLQSTGSGSALWAPQTWLYDGQAWLQLAPTASPSARGGVRIAFDPLRRQTVLFGGVDQQGFLGDTWTIGASPATVTAFGTGCGNPALVAAPNPGSLPILGTTFISTTSNIPATAATAFYAIGLSRAQFGPFPLPLPLDGFGLPGCTLDQDLALGGFLPAIVNANGTTTQSLAIPGSAALAGVRLFQQPWLGAPGANPGGVLTANSLDLLVGY